MLTFERSEKLWVNVENGDSSVFNHGLNAVPCRPVKMLVEFPIFGKVAVFNVDLWDEDDDFRFVCLFVFKLLMCLAKRRTNIIIA